MTGQQLRDSILLAAFTGTFVDQNSEDVGIFTRVADIKKEQKRLIAAKIIKKEKYDATLSEREDKLPSNWNVVKLGDISKVITKQTGFDYSNDIKPNLVDSPGDDCIPMLQTRNFKGKSFNFNTEYYIPRRIASSFPKICLDEPCLLLSIVGASIGNVGYLEQPREAIIGGAICKVTLIPTEFYDYIYYFLQSPQGKSEITKNLKATAQGTIMVQDVREIEVPLPPYEEQKRIVAKIEKLLPLVDEYDKAAEELKALNEALPDKLRKSVLQEAIHGNLVPNEIPAGEATAQELLQQILKERQDRENAAKGKTAKKLTLSEIEEEPWELPEGWCWCRVNDLLDFVDYRGKTPTKTDRGVFLITASNIKKGYLDYARKEYISREEYETRQGRGITERGDLLFTTEAPLGNAAICDLAECSCGQRIITMKNYFKDALCLKTYMYFILSDSFQRQLRDNCTGMTATGIKAERLKKLFIPLPPLSIQKAIVAKIEEVFAAIDKLK